MSKTSKDTGRFSFLLSTANRDLCGLGTSTRPAAPLEQQVKMQVRLYNYADVPPRVLANAEEQAEMTFREAKVEVTWENLTPPKDPSQGKPVGPHPAGSVGIDLRIVGHFGSTTRALRYDAMGFAVPPDTAAISLQWVRKLTSLGIAEEYQVRAVIAHEIGHLFLGPNSHSPVGIMRAGWKEEDLLEASQARLTFTRDQAQRIRTEVRHRQKQQAPTSVFPLAE